MVAKFHQKCSNSTATLDQLKRQIGKLSKSKQMPAQMSVTDPKEADANTDLYYENVDYCEENVEYVIYGSPADIIEETDISNKSNEMIQETESFNSDSEDKPIAYHHSADEVS